MLSDSSIRSCAAENYFTALSQSEGGSQWTHEQAALSVVWTTSVRDSFLLFQHPKSGLGQVASYRDNRLAVTPSGFDVFHTAGQRVGNHSARG